MTEVIRYNNPITDSVIRIVEQNGEPWFVGKDVAEALGYKDTVNALKTHVRDRFKKDGVAFHHPIEILDSMGRKQTPIFINEAGMNQLIMRSKLEKAEQFQDWVYEIVLPQIRKTGGYIAGEENMSDDELLANAVLVALG